MSPLPVPPHAKSVPATGHRHRHKEKRRARTCWRLAHPDAGGWPAGQVLFGNVILWASRVLATDLPFPYFSPREYRAQSVWRP
jgi:hypothetical protein